MSSKVKAKLKFLSVEQDAEWILNLKIQAIKMNITMRQLVKDAVDEYLEKNSEKQNHINYLK